MMSGCQMQICPIPGRKCRTTGISSRSRGGSSGGLNPHTTVDRVPGSRGSKAPSSRRMLCAAFISVAETEVPHLYENARHLGWHLLQDCACRLGTPVCTVGRY